jgi:hypothetical protein
MAGKLDPESTQMIKLQKLKIEKEKVYSLNPFKEKTK